MKPVFLILVLLAVAGYLYVQEKPVPRKLAATPPGSEAQSTTEKQQREPEPKPAEVAKPMEPAAPAAPQAPVRRLAPEGVFFTLQRISVVTDSGVISVAPATKVTVVRQGPPLHVTDGKNEFDITPDQVTNDLEVIGQVYQAYAQRPAQSSQPVQPAPDARAAERARQELAAKGEVDSRRAQAILELRSRLGLVARKEAAAGKLVADIRNAFNSGGRITYNGKHPTLYDMTAAESDFDRLFGERREIENKITELQR